MDLSEQNNRAATLEQLQWQSKQVSEQDLLAIYPMHEAERNRKCLGILRSQEGRRYYYMYQQREKRRIQLLGIVKNLTLPRHDTASEIERLWQEMTRLRMLVNHALEEEISDFHKYPPDLVFIDVNWEVYVLFTLWEPRPEDLPEIPGTTLDDVIERCQAASP